MCILKNGASKWRGEGVDLVLMECMEIHKSAAILEAVEGNRGEENRIIGSWYTGEMRHAVQMSEKLQQGCWRLEEGKGHKACWARRLQVKEF